MVLSADLVWIVVSDFERARTFLKETLGLRELNVDNDYKWGEYAGTEGGAYLGIAQNSENSPIPAGNNAIITFTVKDIEQTREELRKKRVKLLGDVVKVPGHVKLQLFEDPDGNKFQLVEMIG